MLKYRVWYNDGNHIAHQWFDAQDKAKKFIEKQEKKGNKPLMREWEFEEHPPQKEVVNSWDQGVRFIIAKLEGKYYVQCNHAGYEFPQAFDTQADAENAANQFASSWR